MVDIFTKIYNYTIAIVRHTISGQENVDSDTYTHRVTICNSCPLNFDGECGMCGCPIAKKALWATEQCPDLKWHKKMSTNPEEKTSETSARDLGIKKASSGPELRTRRGNCSTCKKRTK